MIATEMLKELKLKKLPVNLQTMVDVLVSMVYLLWCRTPSLYIALLVSAGAALYSE